MLPTPGLVVEPRSERHLQFYFMNPSLQSDCPGLAISTYYYISIWPRGGPPPDPDDDNDDDPTITDTTSSLARGTTGTHQSTPSPMQTDMVSNCNSFYEVNSSDGYYDVANSEKIVFDDFTRGIPPLRPTVRDCRRMCMSNKGVRKLHQTCPARSRLAPEP
ncbi:hypothetical protein QQX98_002788 [Neonectria punicea]|uniref:Uncharacterized protein n=1 Tax=Neonectria punicea TaxID=979145 RepID=A0ABR1HHI9_9HYPO